MREWRNRQTRTVQVRVPERVWGFNSPLAHHDETTKLEVTRLRRVFVGHRLSVITTQLFRPLAQGTRSSRGLREADALPASEHPGNLSGRAPRASR